MIDFDQSDGRSRVVSFFYDQNRFSSDRDRGDVGVWAPLACAHDWKCDSQSVVDFAKWRQNRDRVDADTRRVTEAGVAILSKVARLKRPTVANHGQT